MFTGGSVIPTEVKFDQRSLGQLQRAMNKVPRDLAAKHLNFATRKAAIVFQLQAKANAASIGDSGLLAASMSVVKSKNHSKIDHVSSYFVRPQKNSKSRSHGGGNPKYPGDPFYWTFVEFGTINQAAQPFVRPAFSAKKAEALGVFVKTLKSRLKLKRK